MKSLPTVIARFIERKPGWLILAILVITAALVPGITLLETETGLNTLVSSNSRVFQETEQYEKQFGAEEIKVLLTGQLDDIFSPNNLAILGQFEQGISQDQRYRTIVSPVTILQLAAEREKSEGHIPDWDAPTFVDTVLYDANGSINPEMGSLVPDTQHALIIVTPLGTLEHNESLQAMRDIDSFFSTHPLDKVQKTVTSNPKIMEEISKGISRNMGILLGLSVAVMALILFFIFHVRWRLLSLLMVGIGVLWTFGIMGYLSVPLSMATMAVLPVLIGLGIDYSIQFQTRYHEEVIKSRSSKRAIISSISRMFPAVGIALLVTIIGFITLYISDVPMVRHFGLMLAIGTALSYVVALFLLHSIVYIADKNMPADNTGKAAIKTSHQIERALSRLTVSALGKPLLILVIIATAGIAGGMADRWLPTTSEFEKLMPQDTGALKEARELREVTGHGAPFIFSMQAKDVTDPDILRWLKAHQDETVDLYPELISASSPATIISKASGGDIPERQQIDQILDMTPPIYLEQVLSTDHKMGIVSFRSKHISLERAQEILEQIIEDAQPPNGVSITPVGTLAIGASTVDAILGKRFTMNILCLSAILGVLLLLYRRFFRSMIIIMSVGLVIAWVSLSLYLSGIALNPLTAILSIIVIGICTEFVVLLLSRYDEERKKGESPRNAMVIALSKIGRAIVTTALTTLGGFGVLMASDFIMIRDFGIATTIGIFLCLVSSMLVVPPLVVWFDEKTTKKSQSTPSEHTTHTSQIQ